MNNLFVFMFLLAASLATGQQKIRVIISNSDAWESSGGFVVTPNGGAGKISGGSRPQTVEIMKTFSEKCKSVQITNDPDKAEYVVLFDRQGGKGVISKDSKIAVFERGGDLVIAKSVRSVGGAVKDACAAIRAQSQKLMQ